MQEAASLVNASIRVRSASRGAVVLDIRTDPAGQFSAPSIQPGIYFVEALDASGQVIGVSPTVSTIAGETAMVSVTAAGTHASRALALAGFSLFGIGHRRVCRNRRRCSGCSGDDGRGGGEQRAGDPSPSQ